MGHIDREDRRRNGGLTEEQYAELKAKLCAELQPMLKAQLWADVYQSVGKSVLTKGLYLCGLALVALAGWLSGSGHLKWPGASN